VRDGQLALYGLLSDLGYPKSPRPSRGAITAAAVRLRVPSLARMFETCTLAVLAAMNS
jgi:hypothetical protein